MNTTILFSGDNGKIQYIIVERFHKSLKHYSVSHMQKICTARVTLVSVAVLLKDPNVSPTQEKLGTIDKSDFLYILTF